MRFYLSLILLFILLLLAFAFALQNEQIITVNYFIASIKMPIAMAVSIFTALGFFMGLIVVAMWKFSRAVKKKLPFQSENTSQKSLDN